MKISSGESTGNEGRKGVTIRLENTNADQRGNLLTGAGGEPIRFEQKGKKGKLKKKGRTKTFLMRAAGLG